MNSSHTKQNNRRGAIAVLAAIFIIVMLGMVAFAVDVGYLSLVRTQLQSAADAAALAGAAATNLSQAESRAAAQQIARLNTAAGRPVQLASNDIQFGVWDTASRTFSPGQSWNAVKVTARTSPETGGATALFFARIFGMNSVNQQASAIATVNPRDIAFVVDLSGSMNDDTMPGSSTATTALLQNVFDDFGFGSYPGTTQWAGKPLLTSSTTDWVNQLTKSGGPLRQSSIAAKYRVLSTDSSAVKTWKAYAWVMEQQMGAGFMSAATPAPNAGASYSASPPVSYSYWKYFIDQYPTQLGYQNYLKHMMYYGRNDKPNNTCLTPLSVLSGICPRHNESVGGTVFQFPPREMPTHAARRAIIAALQVVEEHNSMISDPNQRDWVSIITFDKDSTTDPVSPMVLQPLTTNYTQAMQQCKDLQACGEGYNSTATESGLICARNHIKPASQGGSGRERANKIVVLLTDGAPNLYKSSTSTINSYVAANPSPNYYTGSINYSKQAPLMQAAIMQSQNWYVYPVGIGNGTDYNFMDRMARMGATANPDGQSPRGSGDATVYEQTLRSIFEQIITRPKLRLVQ
jgi:Flp pilus assembly protein TadG